MWTLINIICQNPNPFTFYNNDPKWNNGMKVSVIVPVYNVESYIADCIQSVMRQTYQGPLECILVDDCGADGSMSIAEGLVAEYDGPIEFRVLHHEHNRGLSAARNTGMDAASGDYVYFLDSDDWISNDCIEKLAEPLRQHNPDIVVGNYKMVGGAISNIELSMAEGFYQESPITHTFCNEGVYVMAWNKLYSKEFLVKNQLLFEEGRIHEDEILAFELSCVEKTFYVVKSETYFYRIRENSIITDKDLLKKLDGYIGILQSVKGKVKRYDREQGIYDFYMFWIRRVFDWVSQIKLDEEMLSRVQELTRGYLEPIPGIQCLRNKHDRLTYYACKREQTYLRYQYVTQEYSNKLKGRVARNILKMLPYKI